MEYIIRLDIKKNDLAQCEKDEINKIIMDKLEDLNIPDYDLFFVEVE